MYNQFWPISLLILSATSALILILRKLPLEETQNSSTHLDENKISELEKQGIEIQKPNKFKVAVKFYIVKVWNFVLVAKDIKPGKFASYRASKLMNNLKTIPKKIHWRTQTQAVPANDVSFNRKENSEPEKNILDQIKKTPKNLNLYLELGNLYLAQQKYQDAKDVFAYLCSHNTTNPDFFNRLGFVALQLNDLEKAVFAYEKSLTLEPAQAKAGYNLGLALHKQGIYEKALDYFRSAIALEPENYKYFSALANCQQEMGDIAAAIDSFKRALSLDPQNLHIQEKIAKLEQRQTF